MPRFLANIPVSLDDFNEWEVARTLSLFQLHQRARAAEDANRAVVYLSRYQYERWVHGSLTPWRVPEAIEVVEMAPLRSHLVVPE